MALGSAQLALLALVIETIGCGGMQDRGETPNSGKVSSSSAHTTPTSKGTMSASYVRLFADENGESHFEDVTKQLDAKDFAPPAAPLYVGLLSRAKSVFVVGVPPDWKGEAPHPSPKHQIFVTVKGGFEVRASDGTVRQFGVGSILWLDDTTGKGHTTRMTTAGDTLILGVEL